jgi:hypothetical protein
MLCIMSRSNPFKIKRNLFWRSIYVFTRFFMKTALYVLHFVSYKFNEISRKNNWRDFSLVWPQWWSFANVSQQGVDFSKKISKIRIISWFDFHRCSHGPSKIRRHFRNKSRSILKLSKNVFYKNMVLNWYFSVKKKFRKNRMIFDKYIKERGLAASDVTVRPWPPVIIFWW